MGSRPKQSPGPLNFPVNKHWLPASECPSRNSRRQQRHLPLPANLMLSRDIHSRLLLLRLLFLLLSMSQALRNVGIIEISIAILFFLSQRERERESPVLNFSTRKNVEPGQEASETTTAAERMRENSFGSNNPENLSAPRLVRI